MCLLPLPLKAGLLVVQSGDSEVGVSLLYTEKAMDSGPIIARQMHVLQDLHAV